MPPVEALTIEYIYQDLTWSSVRIHAEGGVTVGNVLAGAEQLMVIDVERDTSNDPYRSMPVAERRGETKCPCQRPETYFDGPRKEYGEAGLLKTELRGDVWELRFRRATRKSMNYPQGSHAHVL
jgi:hypothetical protein